MVDSSNLIDSFGEKRSIDSFGNNKIISDSNGMIITDKRKEDSRIVKSVKERVNELESIDHIKKDKKSLRGKCCFSPNKSDRKLSKKLIRKSKDNSANKKNKSAIKNVKKDDLDCNDKKDKIKSIKSPIKSEMVKVESERNRVKSMIDLFNENVTYKE